MSRFPDFRGARVVRAVRGNQQYHVVVRFDRESNLRRWKTSEERRVGIARADELSEDEAAITNITGTEQERTLAPARSPWTASRSTRSVIQQVSSAPAAKEGRHGRRTAGPGRTDS